MLMDTFEDLPDIFHRYALAITNGAAPSGNLDTSFMESLGLQGFVPVSGRGTVTGSYSGVLSGQPVTIGFKVLSFPFKFSSIRSTHEATQNSAAQYWTTGSGCVLF